MTEQYKKIGNRVIKYFTKEDIKQIIRMWESATLEEIATVMKRDTTSITYLAKKVRMMGYKLSSKSAQGRLKSSIADALDDIRLGK